MSSNEKSKHQLQRHITGDDRFAAAQNIDAGLLWEKGVCAHLDDEIFIQKKPVVKCGVDFKADLFSISDFNGGRINKLGRNWR